VILRDLTETSQAEEARAHLEMQLRQAQKMEAIGTLAGGIAHDFNNILGAVLGNAELALSTMAAENAARPFVQQILKSADRASSLVRQILAFSRPHDQQRRPLRLDGVIREAVQLLRSTLPTSIVITTDIESATPTVLADSGQVHQVLMNLCTNAGHAIGERPGRLRIALNAVDLDAAAAAAIPELGAGRFAVLSVSDDGIGMDRETLLRIFEPFFTTKEPGVGTGLGLSVAHGIMRAHEGSIRVETERGRGTTFHLYFPASQAAPAAEVAEAEAPPPRGRGERVMLIDDEIALVTVGRMVLERYGYSVTTFTDPVAALAALTHGAADVRLVLTDLTMPGIGGLELAREVQRMRPGLPVLLTTGYTGKLDSVTLGKDGVVGVIQKPFTATALGHAVHAALGALAGA
jgi:nitrogen-specific signal transduction histidine kinase